MKIIILTLRLAMAVSLIPMHAYAQHAEPVWKPFLFNSGAATQKESKEITILRNSFQQFMQALSSSVSHNFIGIRSASNITIGSTEEESLQYLIEASQIIRNELVEKLPHQVLLDDMKNHNPPVSASKQGMILGLRKDLDLFRAQMASCPQK